MLPQHRERHRRVVLMQQGFVNRQSVLLDGAGEYMSCGDIGQIFDGTQTTATFSIWVKTTDGASNREIMAKYNTTINPDQRTLLFDMVNPGMLRCIVYKGGDTSNLLLFQSDNTVFTDNVWHNVLASINLTTANIDLYVDGVEVASTAANQGTPPIVFANTVQPFIIGARITPVANTWNGPVDEAAIWSAEFTSSQAEELYNNGTPTNLLSHSASGDLQGWWRMGDQGTFAAGDWTFPDQSVNSNDAVTVDVEFADVVTDVPLT